MAETVKRSHPIRGVLWGLMLGIGLALVLVLTTVISLDLVMLIAVVLVAVIAGVVWSIYGPAKAPKGPPPESPLAPPPEATRFDDSEYSAVPRRPVEPSDVDELEPPTVVAADPRPTTDPADA